MRNPQLPHIARENVVTAPCKKAGAAVVLFQQKNEVMKNEEVTQYLRKLQPWQVEAGEKLRAVVLKTIPGAEERLQYGKPHYLKNGHYAAVIHAAKDKLSFMIFNATELPEIKGFFKSMSGGPDRKTATITEGQQVDYKQLGDWLKKASAGL